MRRGVLHAAMRAATESLERFGLAHATGSATPRWLSSLGASTSTSCAWAGRGREGCGVVVTPAPSGPRHMGGLHRFMRASAPSWSPQQVSLQTLHERLDECSDDNGGPLSHEDVAEVLRTNGVKADHVAGTIKELEGSHRILRLRNQFYTRPDIIAGLVREILPEGNVPLDRLEAQIHELERESTDLDRRLRVIEEKADKRARLVCWAGLGGLVLQLAVFYRLTYYELSWDLMEPVSYLYGVGVQALVLLYFVVSGKDLSYEGVHAWISRLFTRKMMAAEGISREAYEQIVVTLAKHRHRLQLARKLRG